MKTVVLYPGRFQPMLPHHAEVYRHLQSQFPDAEVYITTSNKVEAGKSPFDAEEKISIMTKQHDIPEDKILITRSPYNWKEYEKSFDSANTKLIFAVGGKDMEGDPRFSFKPKKDGSPSYLQMINTNSDNALPMNQSGYVYSAPTIGDANEAASASAFRSALLSAPALESAKKTYTRFMGEFNQEIFDLVYDKITGNNMKESIETLKKLAGLLDEAPINFKPGKGGLDYEPGISKKDQRAAAERPAKAAASDPNTVGFTKIAPEDMISVDTGKPINSRQRARSMANQFPAGADVNDPAVKKEMFLKLLAQSPGYVLGEINARLANDEEGFAVSDRLSGIVDDLPEGGIMALNDEDRKWTIQLVNNAMNNMELHRKDSSLDKFDDLEEPEELELDMDEPEMVSMDDPEFDAEDDELEMEEDLNEGCPCCNGGKSPCSHGKDVCGTCGGTGKVAESNEKPNFNELRQLAGLPEGRMSDIHQDANEMDKEEFAKEYPEFADDWEGMQNHDDPNEPSQDEIDAQDAHYEIYKKHAEKGSQEENLDLSNVVESIVGEQRIDELNFVKDSSYIDQVLKARRSKIKNSIMQKIASKFGASGAEWKHLEKRLVTSYKKTGKDHKELGTYITVDGEKTYGPYNGIEEYAKAMNLLANSLIMNKDKTRPSTYSIAEPGEVSQDELDNDPEWNRRVRDLKTKQDQAEIDAMPVAKESAPYEPLISEMSYSDLLDYLGVTREEALMDLQDYYAPEQVHKDNVEEYEDKYREDVLEPAAEEISSGHAEPAEPEDEYQEETIELDEFQPDDVAFAPDEEPDWIIIDKDGKEVPGGTMLKGTREPTFMIAAIPPTNDSLAKIQTNNGKLTIPNDWGYDVKRNQPNEPKQGELPLPTPSPHQPNLPNLATPQDDPEPAKEGAEIIELKKRAGL